MKWKIGENKNQNKLLARSAPHSWGFLFLGEYVDLDMDIDKIKSCLRLKEQKV